MRVYESIAACIATLCVAAGLSSVASGVGGCRNTVAVLCVGGEHYPARCLHGQRVNRLQRALPASHTLSYFLILSHNLSRGKQVFALRQYIVCRI